jgi:predicted ATPase
MVDKPQRDFIEMQLDPELLSTPFRVQTNWHVITGAPCCGKTTLINQLDDKGFPTIAEIARQYLDIERSKGRTIDEIHANATTRDRGIKNMQLEVEHGLQAVDFYFLDRALPDSLAFFRVSGLNPNEMLADCFHYRYASVFILDPLPFQPDHQRVEGFAAYAGILGEWHVRDYLALGYRIVRVPVLPPKERLAFMLEKLSEQGLI